MPDREKVVKGLECCSTGGLCITECPYSKKYEIEDARCITELQTDALALLKEQETTDTRQARIFQCKECGYGIEDIFLTSEREYEMVPKYCPNCGRLVK